MNQPVNEKARLDLLANLRDELREEKRDLEARIKVIDGLLDDNEQEILAIAGELGLDRFAVGKLSFSVSRNVVGNVTDWDQVWDYILTNQATHLVQRRLSNAAYKELLDTEGEMPGVEPFTKISLNMRKSA